MKVLLQRVSRAAVRVDGETVGSIGPGLLVLLGVEQGDGEADADYLADKSAELRIFPDDGGKMNRSVEDAGGEVLVVSQFTLLADCRKGRRPSFVGAAEPELASVLYEYFVEQVRNLGIVVATGRFRAMMEVALINEGPVTIVLESQR